MLTQYSLSTFRQALVCIGLTIILIPQASTAQSSDVAKLVPPISLLLFGDPEISIRSNMTIAEGDSETKTVNLIVSVEPYMESTVSYEIVAGASAQAGSDYIAPSFAPIIFTGNVNTATISIDIIGDKTAEPAESFTIKLYDSFDVKLSSRDTATVTIIDEDSIINDTGIQFGAEGLSGNNVGSCTSSNTDITQQDCANGRDAQARLGTLSKLGGGEAGFDFTKLGSDGTPLRNQNGAYNSSGSEANGTLWSCVRDNHTGLIWEVKTIGGIHDKDLEYQWGGITSIGRESNDREGTYLADNDSNSWDNLVNSSNANGGLCGLTDWHVPSLKAFQTVVNRARFDANSSPVRPSIDTNYFPNTPENDAYWTASPYSLNTTDAWEVSFATGISATDQRNNSLRVRLVSGEHEPVSTEVATAVGDNQQVENYIDNTTPDSRYVVSADSSTVTDTLTGLMWQRCVNGLSGSDCLTGTSASFDWPSAISAAASSTVGGFTDWRLPNVEELRTLRAYDRFSPAINANVFPNTPDGSSYELWTGSPTASAVSSAFTWLILTTSGNDRNSSRVTASRGVRLVRSGVNN